MFISKYNNEGYHDPTTYEALTNIIREEKAVRNMPYKPLVYICSPYAGDIKHNVENARKYCRFAYEQNTIPFASHLLFPQFMDDNDPLEREMAMHFNYVMLGKCNELWVFGSVVSRGMEREITVAKKRRQKIRWFDDEMREVD